MKRQLLTIMTVLSLIGVVPQSSAQTQAEMKKLGSELDNVLNNLGPVSGNINGMVLGVEPDLGWADLALSSIMQVSDDYQEVSSYGLLAEQMRDPRDYQIVLRRMRIKCNYAKKTAERATTSLNSTLVRLTSIALITEITRARELIQLLRGNALCAEQ